MKKSMSFLALAAALVLAVPLAAQPVPVGPEIALDQGPSSYESAIAAAADGGFLGVWSGSGQEGRISARAFAPDGTPRSPITVVRPVRGGHRSDSGINPTVVALSGGGYVVVWLNFSTTTNGGTIFFHFNVAFRLLDAAGQPTGPETVVAEEAGPASVAALPTGGFVLAWNGQGGDASLIVRRFDAHGVAVGEDIPVTPQGAPSLAALPDGGFVIAWTGDTFLLRYRIFAADGTPRTPTISVQTETQQLGLGLWISADAFGRFVIAWIDRFPDHLMNRVRARLFGPGGDPLGPEIAVSPEQATGNMWSGNVAMRPDGSFLVAWEQIFSGEVWARAYGADGLPEGEAFPVYTLPGPHFRPDVAATPCGWLVAWNTVHPYVRSFAAADCGGSPTLYLNGGRFRVDVTWRVPSTGAHGTGTPIPRTGDTGAFWFFQPSNYELLVKVLDGRGANGHFWVFYGSLTNVEFDLTVTDTATGQQRTYHNPAGTMASRADTTAF